MIWPQQLPPFWPLYSTLESPRAVGAVNPCRAVQDSLGHPQSATVSGWMQRLVATCGPQQSLGELTELLSLHHISGVPVVADDGQVLGVVSQTDVAAYLGGLYTREIRGAAGFYQGLMGRFSTADPAVRQLLESKTVEELLTPHTHWVSPQATLSEVIELMLAEHVHRLPVLDEGRLVGLISTFDVLRAIREGGLANHG